MKQLSNQTKKLIADYLFLPLGRGCQTPYFNNKRRGTRGGLRALVGKGTPQEIIEEARIFALRDKVSIDLIDEKALKAFLASHDLGIDCSGLVYHLLDTELKATKKSKLSRLIHYKASWLRTFINTLRPAENINVSTLNLSENTKEISIAEIEPADLIVILNTGPKKTYNHVLFVTEIENKNNTKMIHYIHSYAWPSDGLTGTGVRTGTITLTGTKLIDGIWEEQGVIGEQNYTHINAKEAESVSVRRIRNS